MAPGGPYYVEVRTRSRHSRAVTRPRAARAAPPMPPGHRPRLSALSALRSVRETGEGRAARRLQSRQRHCRLRWRGSRVPARARTRARCVRGLRMRRPPSPSSRWQSARACRRVGGVVEGKVAGGRNSAAVAPPALIEYRALRAAAQADLAHPSPRASRPRSWHTWRRLSGPSLRRSTPCEVAGGRNSAAVAPPAQPSIGR